MVAAVLRKATVTGSHNLQGLMERNPGFWLTIPRKGFISWRSADGGGNMTSELAVTKQNFFIHSSIVVCSVGEKAAGTKSRICREVAPLGPALVLYAQRHECTCLSQDKYIRGIKEICRF